VDILPRVYKSRMIAPRSFLYQVATRKLKAFL
jgi:hypothetical protein